MIKIINKDDTQMNLDEMQEYVGGLIENFPQKVTMNGKEYGIIVNESGLIDGLPVNEFMADMFGVPIFGNAILIEGGLK